GLGIVAILLLAGCAGLVVFHRGPSAARVRGMSAVLLVAVLAIAWWASRPGSDPAVAGWRPNPHSLVDLGLYFLKVGAFTIGGGLTMIAFIQDQVVGQ